MCIVWISTFDFADMTYNNSVVFIPPRRFLSCLLTYRVFALVDITYIVPRLSVYLIAILM